MDSEENTIIEAGEPATVLYKMLKARKLKLSTKSVAPSSSPKLLGKFKRWVGREGFSVQTARTGRDLGLENNHQDTLS